MSSGILSPVFDCQALELAGTLYDGVQNPVQLCSALVSLGNLLDAPFLHLLSRDVLTGNALESTVIVEGKPAPCDPYGAHWQVGDPRGELLSRDRLTVMLCHDHFDDEFVRASNFYRDAMLPFGLRWTLAGTFTEGRVNTVLALSRRTTAVPFEAHAGEGLRKLLPHLQRVCALRLEFDELRQAANSARESFKNLSAPCVLTDEAGRCIETNPAFDAVAASMGIQRVVGRLRFRDSELQSRLESLLQHTHATAVRHDMHFEGPPLTQWNVQLMPWHSVEQRIDKPVRGLILAMFDQEPLARPAPSSLHMQKGARLTSAENEVLAGMLRGLTAKAIAMERNSSYNTVRSQIMSILDKTGFGSQKELMAHMGHSQWQESAFTYSVAPPPATGRVAPPR